MRFLDRLERKYGKHAIHNLMQYIIGAQVIVFILDLMMQGQLVSMLTFSRVAILRGEVWRLITFIFIYPSTSIIFIVFAFLVYYMIGNTLERVWSPFKFNVYYFLGVIIMIITGMIFGTRADVTYLNLSMFFAFAVYLPNYEFRIYFVLPVKVKYLAWLNAALQVYLLFIGTASIRVSILAGFANFMIFFGKRLFTGNQQKVVNRSRKANYRRGMEHSKPYRHKCHVCGRTEKDDPNLEFRYCSKCEGHVEYCSDHLFTHEHIKKK